MDSGLPNGPAACETGESAAVHETKDEPSAPTQESLISDTCQEKFQEEGFEFSVEVESNKPEANSFEREIPIGTTNQREAETAEPPNLSNGRSGLELTVAEESDPAVDIAVAGDEQHEEVTVSVVTPEEQNGEQALQDKVECSPPEIQESVQVKLEAQDEMSETDTVCTPAQHGTSAESYIAVEPEASLVLKIEPPIKTSPEGADSKTPENNLETSADVADVSAKSPDFEEKTKSKKKPLLQFKLKPFKKSKSVREKPEDKSSIDSSMPNFKENVRNIFGTLRRTVSQKTNRKSRSKPSKVIARPPRPPPLSAQSGYRLRKPASADPLDQQSISTGPSIQGTPELSRRQRIQQAFSAMPTGTVDFEGGAHNGAGAVEEERIRPIRAQRGTPLSMNASFHNSRTGLPPKPPRPQSPPVLSPLDYQPYNESPEHSQLLEQRMALLESMDPGSRSAYSETNHHCRPYSTGRLQVNTPQRPPMSPSVNFSQYSEYSHGTPPTVRRAETLRRDYASLIRERVRSLRVEPGAQSPPSTRTMQMIKPRARAETYECSETIKLPKLPFKLKRRKTVPPKANTIGRPPSRGLSDYHDYPSGDYVTVSQVGVVQAAGPRGPAPHPAYQSQLHNISARQLTSLRSLGAKLDIRQQTYTMDSSRKGRLQGGAREIVHTAQDGKPIELPYISDTIQCTAETTSAADDADNSVSKAIRSFQPFFSGWNQYPNESPEKLEELLKTAFGEFLKVCICLRSVDLQGQFSPFHYPLPSFDVRLWRKRATLTDWAQMLVLNEAEWNTDYVYLDPATLLTHQMVYPEVSVDSMLTNWLDCEHAACHSTQIYKNAHSQTGSNAVFHSITIANDLKSILETTPFEKDNMNQLFHACIRLSVLLAYSHCQPKFEQRKSEAGSDLKDTLLILSTSNCLVVFRSQPCKAKQQQTSAAGNPFSVNEDGATEDNIDANKENEVKESQANGEENETKQEKVTRGNPEDEKGFVATVYPEQSQLKEAINALIEVVYKLTLECTKESTSLPDLLKSVAPPDWIALLIARIFVSN